MAQPNGNGADTPQAGPKFSVLAHIRRIFPSKTQCSSHLGPAANSAEHLDTD